MRGPIPEITPFLRLGGRGWRWPAALQALSHYNFRLFWFGQLVSLTGTWMQRTAQQWLVFRLTGSSLKLGVVTFVSFLPVLILSPFAGVLVDRVDKRRLVTLAQTLMMVQAGVMAGLTAAGVIQFWHIVVLALLLGMVSAFEMPARQAFAIDMVGRDDLMNAIALNSSVFNGARIAGPAIAGVLVASVGEAAAFGLNAVSYLAVIAGLLAMRLTPPELPRPNGKTVEQLKEGLGYVAGHGVIRVLVGMVAVFSFFGLSFTTLIPVFAGDVLRVGPQGLGALLSALGVGALVGALSLALLGNFRYKGWLLTAGMLIFALSVAAFSASRWMPLSMLALAFSGWAQITQLATTNTLLQTMVPDGLRGRVMSTYTWMLGGMLPLGSLLMGAVAQGWGAPLAVRAGALVCGAFALLVLWRLPVVRRLA
ncbi:MAG: MFS transporter [Chloroflexi bacterium]|nr:MFS transporter [Chloroflexota bacterium]